jgi:hypothetical protein
MNEQALAVDVTPLSAQERARLGQLERIVEKNLTGFIQCGRALLEIRESQLWRGQYWSFGEYCRERFAIARSTADQLCRSTRVFEVLVASTGALDSDTPIAETTPEIVLRPISQLPDSELQAQAGAWLLWLAQMDNRLARLLLKSLVL